MFEVERPERQVNQVRIEQIKGRYKIIAASIAAVGTIIATALGLVINRNQEIISQQDVTIEELQSEIDEVKRQNTALQNENESLTQDYQDVLAELESISNQTMDTTTGETSFVTTEQKTGEVVKLTSRPVLGNNEDFLNYINNTAVSDETAKSNLGDTFSSSISMRRNGNIDFFLDGMYKTLTFTICMAEETRDIDDYSSTITIYSVEGNGDNETVTQLYTSPAITMGFIPTESPPIDVSGVEHLRISFYADGYMYSVPRIVLGDPELTM